MVGVNIRVGARRFTGEGEVHGSLGGMRLRGQVLVDGRDSTVEGT